MSPFGVTPTLADDGDGGGAGPGGGSAGDSGSGGDWMAPARGGTRASKCVCLVIFCACKQTRARRSKSTPSKEARPAAPPVRHELVVAAPTADASNAVRSAGFELLDQRDNRLLGSSVLRVRAPAGMGRDTARRRIAAAVPGSTIANNDLYQRNRGSYKAAGEGCGQTCSAFTLTAWSDGIGKCSARVRIGMIDTGVDQSHPALTTARITVKDHRASGRKPSSADHGTGVASLLVGARNSEVVGLVPDSQLFAADAFHSEGAEMAADVFALVAALDWLVEVDVVTINMSLSGPDNAVLLAAIRKTIERGVVIVAASGPPASGSSQGYPARYDGVVAVGAIDDRMRSSRLSTRGKHIAFAAPGVGLLTAAPAGRLQRVDGTSFASPFVAAAFAMGVATDPARPTLASLTERLAGSARDLGAPGRDPVYGWGLIQFTAFAGCR
ncbi:MAG TPA: S8 family serine peptidase [Hyphomicrobiaceae bacterium]|nr:S8 family serine peptidase [Hyphomicrobiaceae bacterium]